MSRIATRTGPGTRRAFRVSAAVRAAMTDCAECAGCRVVFRGDFGLDACLQCAERAEMEWKEATS